MATYGHGMFATPSIDGWQYGIRDMNGYRAEIVIYGDGWARGYNHYETYILDYLTGVTRMADSGCLRYPDIRRRALDIMRHGRRNGVHGTVVSPSRWH